MKRSATSNNSSKDTSVSRSKRIRSTTTSNEKENLIDINDNPSGSS